MDSKIALIGFGEAASTFAKAAGWSTIATAFDIDPARQPAMASAAINSAPSVRQALTGAHIVLSLVIADQALKAAQDYAPQMSEGALWCDMNSVAPETKRAAANAIEAVGGRYVDVAVLSPVHPAALAVPLFVSGPHAEKACEALRSLGFANCRNVGAEVGKASTIKMIRSVMVKGVEALTDEMIAAARAAGVADEVLASLDASGLPVSRRRSSARNSVRRRA